MLATGHQTVSGDLFGVLELLFLVDDLYAMFEIVALPILPNTGKVTVHRHPFWSCQTAVGIAWPFTRGI